MLKIKKKNKKEFIGFYVLWAIGNLDTITSTQQWYTFFFFLILSYHLKNIHKWSFKKIAIYDLENEAKLHITTT